MKINFDASYRELQTVIGAPAKRLEPQKDSAAFGKLLASISPDAPQVVETPKVPALKEPLPPPKPPVADMGEGPRASLRFPTPELKPPGLDPLHPPPNAVTEAAEGVKTPAVLGARRILAAGSRSPLAERMAAVRELVGEAGRSQGIDPALGMSVVAAESSFDPNAISKDGFQSKGLFQLLDTTGATMRARLGMQGTYDPYDADQNIKLGIGYLRYLHEIFSADTTINDRVGTAAAANSSSLEKLAVAAFNAGEGRVAAAQRRAQRAGKDPGQYEHVEPYLPEITQNYVRKVLLARTDFDGMFSG